MSEVTPDLLGRQKGGTETTGRIQRGTGGVILNPLKAHHQMMTMKGILEDKVASNVKQTN